MVRAGRRTKKGQATKRVPPAPPASQRQEIANAVAAAVSQCVGKALETILTQNGADSAAGSGVVAAAPSGQSGLPPPPPPPPPPPTASAQATAPSAPTNASSAIRGQSSITLVPPSSDGGWILRPSRTQTGVYFWHNEITGMTRAM
eukprot:symbB.v1.2.000585.t1/scaffold3.1/size669525/25